MDPFEKLDSFRNIDEHTYSCLSTTEGGAYDDKAMLYEKVVSSKVYNKIMWGTSPNDYRKFSKKAIESGIDTSLDIGCGGLIQSVKPYASAKNQFILLDNSIEMLGIAKKRIEKLRNNVPANIKFIQANALELPFENESFSAVMSFGLIHLFEEKQAFIDEAFRVLKPGGKFHFTSLTKDRRLSRPYIKLLIKQGELGKALRSDQVLDLFNGKSDKIKSETIGSMVFIWGEKALA